MEPLVQQQNTHCWSPPPPSLFSLALDQCHVGQGGFDISRLRPLPWGDIFLPTPFPNSTEIPERSGQDNINIAKISQEPHETKAEWFTLLLTVLHHSFKLDTQTDFHSCKHQVDSRTELVHIAFSSSTRLQKLGHYHENAAQLSSSALMNSGMAPNKTTGPEKILKKSTQMCKHSREASSMVK